MSAIRKLEFSTNHAWVANTGTWNEITEVLADGLEPGVEDIILTEMGDGADAQDGVKVQGEFKITNPGALAAGTRTWFRWTEHNGTTGRRIGGVIGCRIAMGKSSIRPLGGGPAYTRVMFSATGAVAGDLIATY